MNASDLLLVALGGGLGAAARWGIGVAQARLTRWPGWTGILVANLLGCLVIGLAAGAGADDPWTRAFIMSGLCGAMTTFSSFAFDCALLLIVGAWGQLVSCVVLSVGAGIPLVLLGQSLGASWLGGGG